MYCFQKTFSEGTLRTLNIRGGGGGEHEWALKSESSYNKCMGKIYCVWNFKDSIWNSRKILHKMMLILYNVENWRALRFKSS